MNKKDVIEIRGCKRRIEDFVRFNEFGSILKAVKNKATHVLLNLPIDGNFFYPIELIK